MTTGTVAAGPASLPEDIIEREVAVTRSYRVPVALGVFALLALVLFGFTVPAGHDATFGLSLTGDEVQLAPLVIGARTFGLVAGALMVALAGLAGWSVSRDRAVAAWVPAVFGALWVAAFLVAQTADATMSLTGLLRGSVTLAIPLVYGALAGVLCERAGVVNIAIEGQLLAGAFFSAVLASATGNPWLGLIAAPIAGLLVSTLLVVFAINYFVEQVIVGVVLNVLVTGVTGFLYGRLLVPNADTLNSPETFAAIRIPLLADIPVIGPALFNQTIICYIMYLAVVVVHVALFKTRWGLRVRAVGEHPTAADTVGIAVNRVRKGNVLLGGAMAGLGGAFFTLGSVGAFGKEMTAGNGFIALAAVIFGRWRPFGALGAALLFGFAYNLQSVLSIVGTNIPSEIMLMLPYVVTIFAVAGLVGRVRAPAASGVPYKKG